MGSRVAIRETMPRQLLQRTSGYLNGYDYSLNPYVGCVFACSYCYVRAMPVARFHEGDWGTYVDAKHVDRTRFVRELVRAHERGPVHIFMSSSTDPYQPAENRYQRTRAILECIVAHIECIDFLFIQTRSPLVTRDTDLLKQLRERVLVSMTIETDREDVRSRFTPYAPKIRNRLRALAELHAEAIPTQIAVSPILPCTENFAEQIKDDVDYVVIDDYFMGDGSNGRRTKSFHLERLYTEDERDVWFTPQAYQQVLKQFQSHLGTKRVFVSQTGFLPPSRRQGQ